MNGVAVWASRLWLACLLAWLTWEMPEAVAFIVFALVTVLACVCSFMPTKRSDPDA